MRITLALLLCVACSVDHAGLLGSDSGPGFDSGPARDGGSDAGPTPDVPVVGLDTGPPPFDAGTDAGPMMDSGPDVPPGCTEGARECDGDVLLECVAGRWVSTPCALACQENEGSASCHDLIPSNLSRPLSEVKATGDFTVMDGYWDTSDCAAIGNYWYVDTTAGAPGLCVVAYHNVTFQNDLRVVGSRPLVVVATGTITLSSVIRADGDGTSSGPGGSVAAYSGEVGETESGSSGHTSDGGGGGGGGYDDGGDGGDAGGSGGSTEADGGSGGASFGDSFIPLSGGGAGGAGEGPAAEAGGGGGGGALQFTAREGIIYQGGMNVGGGGGRGGGLGSSGGGGGGGGTAHFETAGTFRFVRGEVLAAGGGGGGGGACSVGGDGREEEQGSLAGGSRGSDCGVTTFSTAGGDGDPDGSGEDAGDISRQNSNGGGGGGGGGLVVIRATNEIGTLPGTGHRLDGDPVIAAVD